MRGGTRPGGRRSTIAARLLLAAGLAWTLGACTYERTVEWNPPLASLPGARTGMPTTGPRFENLEDPTSLGETPIREETEEGEIVLHARSGRHLMRHIYTTLRQGERELFTEQVLSTLTKEEFRRRGRDPAEAFDMLKEHQDAVKALFDMMPNGELTPGVIWDRLGRYGPRDENIVRLKVTGLGTHKLRWNFMDMVFEGGRWRLRWFGKD